MKKNIIWLIQSNQITPIMKEYFHLLQMRMKPFVDIIFVVPENDKDLIPTLEVLKPKTARLLSRSATHSQEAYLAKKNNLDQGGFPDGLSFSDVLLLDDLGGGDVVETTLELKTDKNTCGMIAQVPTPLGSSEVEERVFHSAVRLAKQKQIFFLGYEFLPLDTRWTLAPSIVDGLITKHIESYSYLKQAINHDAIWMLPQYESAMFSPFCNAFDLNGVKSNYHYKNLYKIPHDRVVLFIPHNVAMVYEYQEMLRMAEIFGDKLHLMFCTGKDQTRGGHTHEEIIKTVYHKELKSFASYSFHDINSHWELCMSDSVVACSACFQTLIAEEKNIQTIIFDPRLPPMRSGVKNRVLEEKTFIAALSEVISFHSKTTELSQTLMQLVHTKGKNG